MKTLEMPSNRGTSGFTPGRRKTSFSPSFFGFPLVIINSPLLHILQSAPRDVQAAPLSHPRSSSLEGGGSSVSIQHLPGFVVRKFRLSLFAVEMKSLNSPLFGVQKHARQLNRRGLTLRAGENKFTLFKRINGLGFTSLLLQSMPIVGNGSSVVEWPHTYQ
jgi:hypothetical protein